MKTLADWLDEAKAITGSDYKTAKQLGLRPNTISMARSSGKTSNKTATEIAQIIGVSPMEIIASIEAHKDPENAPFWAKFSAAFVVGCALILSGQNNSVNATESITYNNNKCGSQIIYYAKLMIADC